MAEQVREFDYDPRLTTVGTSDDTAEELEAKPERVVARETEPLRELGDGTPRERHAAKEVVRFSRWQLGGNIFGDEYTRKHPLVRDRSVRWLQVDANDEFDPRR